MTTLCNNHRSLRKGKLAPDCLMISIQNMDANKIQY